MGIKEHKELEDKYSEMQGLEKFLARSLKTNHYFFQV